MLTSIESYIQRALFPTFLYSCGCPPWEPRSPEVLLKHYSKISLVISAIYLHTTGIAHTIIQHPVNHQSSKKVLLKLEFHRTHTLCAL